MSTAPAISQESEPRLRRVLGLWDLILCGLIVIQPTAPMPVFGVMSQRSQNHAATTVLIAMVAMLFTAVSCGWMACAYPSAGPAFTYVGQEIQPGLGFVTGWGMAMDYMLNPIICTILCSKFAMNSVPGIPYALWAILTYIGSDSISKLSEEAENPRRNILLATVLVCLITDIMAAVEVYAAQLVSFEVPDSSGTGPVCQTGPCFSR
jgi:putrescine importer